MAPDHYQARPHPNYGSTTYAQKYTEVHAGLPFC